MKIQKVAIIGLGAIGGYFLQGFEGSEIDLYILAEGSRKERLKNKEITINNKQYYPRVCTPEETGICDLIIISTKYDGLTDAVNLASKVLGEETIVLSTLNGIDSEEIAAGILGKDHIIHSVMRVVSRRYQDKIECYEYPDGGIVYGNAFMPEDKGKECVEALTQLFEGTSIGHIPSTDILQNIWYKFAGNVSTNLPQAVSGCSNGIFTDSEHAVFLRDKLWNEAYSLALSYGIKLPYTYETLPVAKSTRFSTLQDLDAKRPTEIEMFAGTLIRKSKEKGLDAPFAEYTYHLIKLLEEKNNGKFNYTD